MRLTPHEAMNHEWIMEGRFNKTRGQSRTVSRRPAASNNQTTSSNANNNANSDAKVNQETFAKKVSISTRQGDLFICLVILF